MKRRYLLPLLLLFFVVSGLFSAKTVLAQSADTCNGNIGDLCTVCKWDLASSTCKATNAGFNQWASFQACETSPLYENDPSVCSGINDKDKCNNETYGDCRINPDTDPETTGWKYIGGGECGVCSRCPASATSCTDVEGDDNVCIYNDRDTCLEEELTIGLTKYKCVSNKCVECAEGESGCKTRSVCRESCETKSAPTNSPLSSPCKNPGPEGCSRIKTAFGVVFTNANDFTRWLLGFVLSISGGIVVLIIIISGYRLMTSQGDPEKIKNARDQLTAAIVGLLFIIFSLVILELITKDILGLPGFGS